MVSRRSSEEMSLVPAARSVPLVAGDTPAMREWPEQLVARARAEGVELTGDDGLLTAMVRQVLQTGLEVELTDHLGYESHDPAGRGSGNSRNGTSRKTVTTDVVGPHPLRGPRPVRSQLVATILLHHRELASESTLLPSCDERSRSADDPADNDYRHGLSHGAHDTRRSRRTTSLETTSREGPSLATVALVVDAEMLPQPGRVVLVMLQDGRQVEGELIVMTDHYTVGDVSFQWWEVETIEDVT